MKEAQAVSSGMAHDPVAAAGVGGRAAVVHMLAGTETACEHLGNAQQLAQDLEALLRSKDLVALAGDVAAIGVRLERARAAIAAGNLGRP